MWRYKAAIDDYDEATIGEQRCQHPISQAMDGRCLHQRSPIMQKASARHDPSVHIVWSGLRWGRAKAVVDARFDLMDQSAFPLQPMDLPEAQAHQAGEQECDGD